MTEDREINIFRALDYLRDAAPAYAKAKSERVYIEAFLKSKKALLMKLVEKSYPSAAAQEREALADKEYIELLEALREAVEIEEKMKWHMTAAEARISVWQTMEATKRMEIKAIR